MARRKPKRVQPEPVQKNKIAIVGWAATSREQALKLDDSYEVWACNELGMAMPDLRVDLYFNMHGRGHPMPMGLWGKIRKWLIHKEGGPPLLRNEIEPHRLEWLQNQPVRCLMLEKYDDIPCSEAFPFVEFFTRWDTGYFTSTIAYQLAYALMRDPLPEEIRILGVDMAMDSEYQYQRPCAEYWIGRAESMGVKVHIPKESLLMKTPWVYSIEDVPIVEGPITESGTRDQIERMRKLHAKAMKGAHVFEGALKAWQKVKQRVQDGGLTDEMIDREIKELDTYAMKAAQDQLRFEGALLAMQGVEHQIYVYRRERGLSPDRPEEIFTSGANSLQRAVSGAGIPGGTQIASAS